MYEEDVRFAGALGGGVSVEVCQQPSVEGGDRAARSQLPTNVQCYIIIYEVWNSI